MLRRRGLPGAVRLLATVRRPLRGLSGPPLFPGGGRRGPLLLVGLLSLPLRWEALFPSGPLGMFLPLGTLIAHSASPSPPANSTARSRASSKPTGSVSEAPA